VKRVELIQELTRRGCVFIRHGGSTIGIKTRARKCVSQCRAIAKSRNTWRVP
jgi:hypothetical protein